MKIQKPIFISILGMAVICCALLATKYWGGDLKSVSTDTLSSKDKAPSVGSCPHCAGEKTSARATSTRNNVPKEGDHRVENSGLPRDGNLNAQMLEIAQSPSSFQGGLHLSDEMIEVFEITTEQQTALSKIFGKFDQNRKNEELDLLKSTRVNKSSYLFIQAEENDHSLSPDSDEYDAYEKAIIEVLGEGKGSSFLDATYNSLAVYNGAFGKFMRVVKISRYPSENNEIRYQAKVMALLPSDNPSPAEVDLIADGSSTSKQYASVDLDFSSPPSALEHLIQISK